MESLLQEKLETTLQNPGIHGIVCTDMQGLCLGNQGAAFEELAGPIAALCEEAYKQWPSQVSTLLTSIHSKMFLYCPFKENCKPFTKKYGKKCGRFVARLHSNAIVPICYCIQAN